jgi:ABC-2 type transport system permease protein
LLIIPQQLGDFETKIQFVSNSSPSISLSRMSKMLSLQKITNSQSRKRKFRYASHSKAQVKSKYQFNKHQVRKKGLNEIKIARRRFGYLIMMFIIIYGNMVMRL